MILCILAALHPKHVDIHGSLADRRRVQGNCSWNLSAVWPLLASTFTTTAMCLEEIRKSSKFVTLVTFVTVTGCDFWLREIQHLVRFPPGMSPLMKTRKVFKCLALICTGILQSVHCRRILAFTESTAKHVCMYIQCTQSMTKLPDFLTLYQTFQ